MNISNFLNSLKDKDILLSVQDERLVCNSPKGVLTPKLQKLLMKHKREIVEYIQINDNGKHNKTSSKILSDDRNTTIPLSFAQQRLWILDQIESNKAIYHIPFFFRLKGELNVQIFEMSINALIKRHEVLRTAVSNLNGQPVQKIADHIHFELPIITIVELNSKSEIFRIAREEFTKPFHLEKGPLFRLKLLRLNQKEHILLFTIHHMISDALSNELLLKELSILYNTFLAGEESPLPPLVIQYADFTIWQLNSLQGEVYNNQLSYWKKQLKGKSQVLELPSDYPRPSHQSFNGAFKDIMISEELTNKLKTLCREQNVTLFILLLSAFKLLLYRYTNQNSLIIGIPSINRNRTEFESIVGLFMNTLLFCTDFSNDLSFIDLLYQVRKTALEAYSNQDIPFEKLVEELKPERDLSRNPLFQVMFTYENAPESVFTLSNVSIEPMNLFSKEWTSKFDLTLYIKEKNHGIQASFEYNTDLFKKDTIIRMANHFQNVLKGIVNNPERKISEITILSEREKQCLLYDWNDTYSYYPEDKSFHHLFEEQVKRTPDAVAIKFNKKQITYNELNKRSNQLAHFLQKRGITAEKKVGIYIDRSLDMVIGLIGTLKSGGAYVPLDPNGPSERLVFMIEDSQLSFLLTQSHLLSTLPALKIPIMCLDQKDHHIQNENVDNIENIPRPADLAYLIYTSGSTGKPKGVQITHRSLTNFLISIKKEVQINKKDKLLAVTTISFDISILELFLPLIVGAQVILAVKEVVVDAFKLKNLIDKSITIMQATPATWHMLLEAEWNGNPSLKLLCGGEALTKELASRLLLKAKVVYNLYGPTETTVWSIINRIENINIDLYNDKTVISIGRPIANTQIYILDQHLNPVPIGIPGELFIGGDGLARGYLNRPELTKEKFITNPFEEKQGSRLYKTGDLARYLPDGNIQFIGRLDRQVKIRGYRIECKEIEIALTEHPGVNKCSVTVLDNDLGDKYLVAYIVPADTNNMNHLSTLSLRKFLREKLPPYMIPSHFVQIDSMPLNPNGKVDYKKLQSYKDHMIGSHHHIPPTTQLEKEMATIWRSALHVKEIGMNDNFFDLGGHSLLALRVIYEIEKRYQFRPEFKNFINHTLGQFISCYEKEFDVASKQSVYQYQ